MVVNIDSDMLELPPLSSLVQAADTASQAQIVCANGYEQWSFPVGITLLLYYDTFASVDQSGHMVLS